MIDSAERHGSMNDYAKAVYEKRAGTRGANLRIEKDDKLRGENMLELLGLPRFPTKVLPLKTFIADPNSGFRAVNSRYYHVSLRSDIESKRQKRSFPLTRDKVLELTRSFVPESEVDKFTIILKGIRPNIYGGNMIINPSDGSVVLEVVRGEQIAVSQGGKAIIAFGYRPPLKFLRRVEFFADSQHTMPIKSHALADALRKTIDCIPKSVGSGDNRIEYHPGYYEFVLVRKGKSGLRPVFIDFSDKPVFQTISEYS